MAETAFPHTFDLESYVQKRLLEIENLEERKLYKEVAQHLLLALNQQHQEAMEALEERVFAESTPAQNSFFITLGLTDQAHYDASDPYLFPVFPEDAEASEVSGEEMVEALKAGQPYPLYQIYLQAPYPVIQQFADEKRQYTGVIKTPNGEFAATFAVNRDLAYQEKLMALYQSFMGNDVPWNTVCAAYLHKRFTVSICGAESLDKVEEVTEIVVDFQEYANYVRYRMVPLWNIEQIEEKTSVYPIPCGDKQNFEHRIYAHRLQADCSYLVASGASEVSYVYRSQGDLVIVAAIPMPHTWHLYKFNTNPPPTKYKYPLLSNGREKNFTDRLNQMFHKQVRTKAGIAAVLKGFACGEKLVYQGLELVEERPEQVQTYDLDDFITAEITTGSKRQTLRLFFTTKDPSDYLNYDIMSFLVTQVQAVFPDYSCVGELVEPEKRIEDGGVQ